MNTAAQPFRYLQGYPADLLAQVQGLVAQR